MEKPKMVDIIAMIVVIVASAIPLATGLVGAAPNGGSTAEHAAILGIWKLVPPILALLLAFLTRNVILSLFLGVLCGAWMLALLGGDIIGAVGGAFFGSTEYFISTLADRWNAGIIMQVLVIGALIALITHMGGMRAVASAVAKRAKGPADRTDSHMESWALSSSLMIMQTP